MFIVILGLHKHFECRVQTKQSKLKLTMQVDYLYLQLRNKYGFYQNI